MILSKPFFTILSPYLILALLVGKSPQAGAQTISSTQDGTQGGFYYYFWKELPDSASMTLLPEGHYSCKWNQVNNVMAGKGWKVGSPTRVIDFTGSFMGGNNGNLAVYGWMRNPLIEYYVVENHGVWTPPGGVAIGTLQSDGGAYQIYRVSHAERPSIEGIKSFETYWSVRNTKRSSGTVTFANHVAAWREKGLPIGSTWDYQIMATEGYMSTGSSDITISEGVVTGEPETTLVDRKGLVVSPNPVANRLTVILPSSQAELSLHTDKGDKVMDIHAEKQVVEIDVSEFGSGIYLLKVESEGQRFTEKVVVL